MTLCEKIKQLVSEGWKLVDVRTETEFNASRIKGAENIQMHEAHKFNQNEKYLLYCQSGARSGSMVQYLKNYGVEAKNIGGISQYLQCLEY